MKPTIKVSIGGMAFDIEEDAYHVFNDYLQALKQHFQRNAEAEEIINDIELRMSELLQMRMKSKETIFTLSDAQEIISIMGNPKDFEDSTTSSFHEENIPPINDNNKKNSDLFEKKLYRDNSNKIIGGVCSGIGHYFRIDPTAIRIGVATAVFLLYLFSFKAIATIVLAYILLWIIMPAAKTFKQKLAMTGDNPSIENIEERTQSPSRKYKGASANSFIKVFVNVIAILIAIVSFISFIGVIALLIWLYVDTDILGATNYMVLLGYNTLELQTALVVVLATPALGLFWLMMKIVRRSSFTTSTLVSFIIGLVIWIGALAYIGNTGFKFAYSFQQEGENIENIAVNTTSDTLYVKIGEEYMSTHPQPINSAMFYRGEKIRDRQVTILPPIKIEEDSLLSTYKIEIKKVSFANNKIQANRKAESAKLDYILSDSLLTIKPNWYDKSNKWNLENYIVTITKPANKKVIIESPLRESYWINPNKIYNYGYNYHYYNHYFD